MSEPQPIDTDLIDARDAVGTWAEENFGIEQPAYFLLRGISEERGELDTSVLKRAQGIDDSEKYVDRVGDDAERDAIGDMFIYLMDFCARAHVNMADVWIELDHGDRIDPDSIRYSAQEADRLVSMEAMAVIDAKLWDLENTYLQNELRPVSTEVAALIDALTLFCEIRGFDFDAVVTETMSEVLDREWDADITLS